MDIPTLSLLVAALAVFVGPIASWSITKRQIRASSKLVSDQILSSLEASNKQIIAPMRQAWINNLRDLLAELISCALHYYVAGFEDRTDMEYQRISLLESKVILMLNAEEDDHQHLQKLVREMINAIEYKKGQKSLFPDLHNEVTVLSRVILKREWDRIKEPIPTHVTIGDA